MLGRADQPGQLDHHPDERLAREGPQPPHRLLAAPRFGELLTRLPLGILETDVTARPRQRLRALRLVLKAGVVEGLYGEGALSFGTAMCSSYRDSP